MPSGYTANITHNITFDTFVKRCARAFGALIHMRDEPWDTPLPVYIEPSPYHLDCLTTARERLEELQAMSLDDAERSARADFEASTRSHETRLAEVDVLTAKYNTMLDKTRAWTPPSVDHEGLKAFMLKQLEESIRFDCDKSYYLNNPPVLLSGAQWLAAEVAQVQGIIDYHQNAYEKECANAERKNEWLQQLLTSLKEIKE